MAKHLPPVKILRPRTLSEASELASSGDEVALYAGGTELLLALKAGALQADTLIDLKTVDGLRGVHRTGESIEIGALATHRDLSRSQVLCAAVPALAQLESRIANPRVRAVGTIGGNLAFAEPHSDPATLLLALDATIRVESPAQQRSVTIDELLVGPYDAGLAVGEIIRSVVVPLPGSHQHVRYQKVQLHERPTLGVAVRLDLDSAREAVTGARLVIGAASPVPTRSRVAEQLLLGDVATISDRLPAATERLVADADIIDDEEGTAEYKAHLVAVHLGRMVAGLLGREGTRPRQRPPVGETVAGWRASQRHTPKPGFRVVGHSVPRTDGTAKLTGQAIYTCDVALPEMAHAKLVRSDVAHANLRGVHVSAALAVDGVLGVLVGEDLLRLTSPRYGHATRDHWILATGKIRYLGEPVAAVIAESEAAAQYAAQQVVVDYEEIEPVLTAEAALEEGALVVHEQRHESGASPGHVSDVSDRAHPNLLSEDLVKWGDIDSVFARADTVVEGDYYYPMTFAYPLEPYIAVAHHTGNELTVYSCGQHTYMVRRDLADTFGLPLSMVRVITPFVGGGFGSKSYTKVEPLTAACSWFVRRPVRLELSLDETILTTRADDARIHLETAVDAAGKLIGRRAKVLLNSGAYAENGQLVSAKTAVRLVGPYHFEAVEIRCRSAYTNTIPASSYRGFGGFHATLASEVQMDELAHRLGVDPIELRMRNLAASGDFIFPGKRPLTADAKGDLRLVAEALDWKRPRPFGRGIGTAINAVDAGAAPVGRAEVRVHGDGSVTVLSGSAELGQGSRTVLAQIAAEEFGLTLDEVRVVQSDTAHAPFARSTGADRTTTMEGTAVIGACSEAKQQLREMATEIWEAPGDLITIEPTGVRIDELRMSWSEVIGRFFNLKDMEVVGRAHIRQTGDWRLLPPFWELPLVGTEAVVDPETGDWWLGHLVMLGDVGLAINPAMAKGQDIGSAMMGLGVALREELVYEGQQLINGTPVDYTVPSILDLPDRVQTIMVENQDGIGPYGAKGHGDGSLSSMCAAVSNALRAAVGVSLHQPPFTPERVWRAMRDAQAQ